MTRKAAFSAGFHAAFGAAMLAVLLVIVWYVLRAVLGIATPFVAGLVFALLLDPLVDRIQERWAGGRRLPAVALVFVGFLAAFVGLVAFIIPMLVTQSQSLVTWFTPMTYAVQRSTEPKKGFQTIESGLIGTEYLARDLTNGVPYYFKIVAVDSNGQKRQIGNIVRVVPTSALPPPGTVLRPQPEAPSPSPSASALAASPAAPSPTASPAPSPSPAASPDGTESPAAPEASPSASPADVPIIEISPRPPAETPTPAAPAEPVRGASPEPSTAPAGRQQRARRSGSWLFDGDGAAWAADSTPTPTPAPAPSAAPIFPVGGRPILGESTPLVAVPGDGSASLAWAAPTKDVAGIDRVRVDADKWLGSHHKLGPFTLPANFESIATQYGDQVTQALKSSATRFAEAALASASGLLSIILVPIVTFYVLADIDRLRGRLMYLLPERFRSSVHTTAMDVGNVFGSYVRGMLIVMLLYGLTAMLVFAWPLKSYALLLGVTAGVLYAVPYLGALIAVLLVAILSLITGHGMTGTLLLMGLLLAQNQVFDNLVVPRVVGKSVGLHPLLTLFALLLGGGLFGLWGMLLSVPVAASIQQILFRLFPKLASPTPLSMMMAANPESSARSVAGDVAAAEGEPPAAA